MPVQCMKRLPGRYKGYQDYREVVQPTSLHMSAEAAFLAIPVLVNDPLGCTFRAMPIWAPFGCEDPRTSTFF